MFYIKPFEYKEKGVFYKLFKIISMFYVQQF